MRLSRERARKQVFRSPPFLVIEILSKDDREPELLEKIHDYLDCGVRYVWVIDPARRTCRVHTPPKGSFPPPTASCGLRNRPLR